MSELEKNTYHMSEEELHELQAVQRDLICEVDRICKKFGITYNMVGGTMLGAIRHKGYIPWDDDADIGFLREEYEKFREACKTELNPQKYYMQDFRDTPGYRWGYGKLRRRGTEFLRANQEHMTFEKGISIDLMPFDPVPDGKIARIVHFFRCFLFRKFLWSEAGKVSDKSSLKRSGYFIMSLYPESRLKTKLDRFIKRNKTLDSTELVRILTFPTPKGIYGYKRCWYEDLVEYPFDELKLPGARDYDGYLKVKYGDYMKLPPENKRKVHPIVSLKLPEEEI